MESISVKLCQKCVDPIPNDFKQQAVPNPMGGRTQLCRPCSVGFFDRITDWIDHPDTNP